LFRYSDAVKDSGTIDWTVDTDTEYFSVDGGQSQLATFTNGAAASANADNYQVSHFRDGTNSVMRPTLSKGQRSLLTGLDLQIMDAIGWDRSAGSQTNYQSSTISHLSDGDGFDGALSWGGWSNTNYNYNFWQVDGFLASTTGESSNHQDVPEPGMFLGLGAIALYGIKILRVNDSQHDKSKLS
ncbi:MAG: NF038122 family metalloprotease, partial [Cyanobacteria bacterium P01_F01_bin.116]